MDKKVIQNLARTSYSKESRFNYSRLDYNENSIGLNDDILKEILSSIKVENIAAYPEVFSLYEQLSIFLGVNEEELILTNGSDAAIRFYFESYTSSNEKVMTIEPSFAMYDVYCKMFSLKKIPVEFDSNHELNIEKLKSNINKVDHIIIANPNSPSGTIIEESDLKDIFKEANRNNVNVFLDEAYWEFYKGLQYVNWFKDYKNVIICRTFSKAWGLAGLRIGYILGDKDRLSLIRNIIPTFDVNNMAILFANYMIEHIDMVQNYINVVNESKKCFEIGIDKCGIKYLKGYGNFVLFQIDDADKKDKIYNSLIEKKILIRKGFLEEPFNNFMRVTMGSLQQMLDVIEVIKEN